MLVSGLIHIEVADTVTSSEVGNSVGDVLANARMIKACKLNNVWTAVNWKKKRIAMLDAFNTSIEVVPRLV